MTTLTSFLSILAAKHTAPFVSVVSETEPELLAYRRGSARSPENKCPHVSVRRKAWGSFQLGSSYENRVNNAAAKVADDAPTFRAADLWRGKGTAGDHPFTVKHTESGKHYLACLPVRNGLPHKKADEWTVDGRVLEGAELEQFQADWLKDWRKGPSAKQAEVGLTEVGQQVHPRCYHLENVVSVECGAMGWNNVDGTYGV